jgi:catechol 2,3-dioxygenase-like lactoylglutathione lyase family enzyme
MSTTGMATALVCADPRATSALFVDHLGFSKTVDLDWFVDLVHPAHPDQHLAFLQQGHPSLPEPIRGTLAGGVYITLVVDDVRVEAARLSAAGVPALGDVRDEPWGQRRIFIQGEGLLVELLQPIPPDRAWLSPRAYDGPRLAM